MTTSKEVIITSKILNWKWVVGFTAVYSLFYGLLFGLLDGGDINTVLYSGFTWMLIYGYFFSSIFTGIGFSSVFYICISFGQNRQSVFRIWFKAFLINIFYGIVFALPILLFSYHLMSKGENIGLLPFYTMIGDSAASIGSELVISNANSMLNYVLTGIGLVLSFGVMMTLLVTFFTVMFMRFGWQVMLGTIFVTISVMLLTLFSDLNVLFTIGYYTNYYTIGCTLASLGLLMVIKQLSKKLEVKS